jgi:apolipoprotein D and lipocalin family protein
MNSIRFGVLAAALSSAALWAQASPAIEQLNVAGYMGRWYQVAHYPNRFQKKCLSDTSATYRLLENGQIEVRNECRTEDGMFVAMGQAKPRGSQLEAGVLRPASLQVAFAPTWTRWLSAVWGSYDVIRQLEEGQVTIVSEPNKEFLWILSRKPTLSSATWEEVETWLRQQGFEPGRLQRESRTAAP